MVASNPVTARFARLFIPTLAAIALLASPTVARDANGFWMGAEWAVWDAPNFSMRWQPRGRRAACGVLPECGKLALTKSFQTGFNSEAEGIFDIFKSLGADPTLNALYAIEPWCASNPDEKFADAVLALSSTLRRKFIRIPASPAQ
jgi:hypothetical protein